MIEKFGNGSINRLKEILKNEAPEKVLIVTGGNSYALSGAQKHIEEILGTIKWYRHYGFEENPKFPELFKGGKIVQEFSPDLIIAVGGGSVLDTAKIISIIPNNEVGALSVIKGERTIPPKRAPIVAIPTTSGSGSEATHFAVAYIGNTKYSVANKRLLPEYVLLDPELTYSMSSYQTAVSGMDALCQGIESYWAIDANDESRKYSSEAIRLILDNLECAVINGKPRERSAMAKGSFLAGKAINITKTTAPHALSYGLTSKFSVPHGHAVAMILYHFIVLNYSITLKTEDKRMLGIMTKLMDLFNVNDIDALKKEFLMLMDNVGLPMTIAEESSDNEKTIDTLVTGINIERLKNHPLNIKESEIRMIYEKVIQV